MKDESELRKYGNVDKVLFFIIYKLPTTHCMWEDNDDSDDNGDDGDDDDDETYKPPEGRGR